MRVAFYLDLPTEEYLWFAKKAAIRARNRIPGAHLTLLTTRDFPGLVDQSFDLVERLDLKMDCFYGYRKCVANSTVDGECLFLDVDCIVQRDVSPIWDTPFDLALCLRYMSKMVEKTPFNGGVAFSRSREFWRDVAGKHSDHTCPADTERRFSEVAMNDKYVIRALNGDIYNYSPKTKEEDVSGRAIVHYKGDRKSYLFP